jgi:hypothetical protein
MDSSLVIRYVKGGARSAHVERTFSWTERNQCLAKDFENLAETLTTFVILASLPLAVRRLARVGRGSAKGP